MTFGSDITFSGLASGLDTAAIIDALVRAERVPIDILESRKSEAQSKIELIGTFEGHVKALKAAAEELATPADFFDYSTTISESGIASVSATGDAAAGSHTIDVQQLAASHRVAFAGVADPDADLASADGQTLSFDYDGTNYSISVNQANSSLNEIAAAINGQTNGEVTATVVNSGTAAAPNHQLVLSGQDTGDAFQITGLTTDIAGLGATATLSTAADAIAVIDGLTVRREDNDFSDVIPGVSIQVESVSAFGEATFTVGADVDAIKGKISDFVDAYNEVIDFVNAQNTYTEEGGAGGELFGDTALSSTQSTIRSALFGQSIADVTADTLGFGTLRLIGIELDNDGRLSIDDAKLTDKISEDLDAVADLFVDTDGFDNGGAAPGDPNYYVDTTADAGLADTLARSLDRLISPVSDPNGPTLKGLFQSKTDALNEQIQDFDDTIENKERQLEIVEQQLVNRFAALEELMGQLNSQQAFLSQQLQNLPS